MSLVTVIIILHTLVYTILQCLAYLDDLVLQTQAVQRADGFLRVLRSLIVDEAIA
jgi:hypothetical protein